MDKIEATQKNFLEGCNCCQAVLLSYAQEFGMDEKTALRISGNFGAGYGKVREVCGAVSGMTMVAGLAKGYDEVNNAAAKAAAYDLERKIVEEFRARNGALTCRELLEIQEKYKESGLLPNKEPFNTQRPCIYLVKSAIEILEKDVFDR